MLEVIMASLNTPKTWIPYMNNRDCSQGFCSLYCPQWCYIIYPPPPPFEFPDDGSGTTFSPLVIAIISILASAFLLVSYYTIISKYCGNSDSSTTRGENHHQHNQELDENHNPSLHEPWQVPTAGLDEALIKSITVCKYKKGDGLVEVTDCSVCLSEFEEDESIRLLPKCSHAFHLPCIDTWLKSHSNCPLCRANIVFQLPPPPPPPPAVAESSRGHELLPDIQLVNENAAAARDTERVAAEEEMLQNDRAPKTPLRVFSDLGNLDQRDTIIEIRDEGCHQHFRRSVSMDHSCPSHTSVADILRIDQEEAVDGVEDSSGGAGSSKHSSEGSKSSYGRRVLHCVLNPATMKRSFSSGRFFLPRHG